MGLNFQLGAVYGFIVCLWFITIWMRERRFSSRDMKRKERQVKEYHHFGRFAYVFWGVDGLGTLAEITMIPVLVWRVSINYI